MCISVTCNMFVSVPEANRKRGCCGSYQLAGWVAMDEQ